MKKIKLKKRWIVLTAVSVFMLIVYGVLSCISDIRIKSVPGQSAVKYWSPDSSQYSQTSCFISESYGFDLSSVYQMRSAVDSALEEASIKKTDEESNARLWIDAYSGESMVNVSCENSSSIEAKALFCGGDFFYFHQFDYKSGYCFSEDDINHDMVVIDEKLAWKLYGSDEVDGMEIYINGKMFIIAGVTECKDDKISEITYGSTGRIYIPYSAYQEISESSEEDLPVTCYEILIPSPVSKFGYNIIKNHFSDDDKKSIAVVENSSRYSLKSLFSVIKNYSQRSIITNDVAYPFWENYARVMEDKLAVMLILRIPFLVIPIIYFIVAFIIFWKRHGIHSENVKAFVDKIIDNRRKKVYYRKKGEADNEKK